MFAESWRNTLSNRRIFRETESMPILPAQYVNTNFGYMGIWQNTQSINPAHRVVSEVDNPVLRKSRGAYKARDLQSSMNHAMSY